MKKYARVYHVVSSINNSQDFNDKIRQDIQEAQDIGYQVDVQYQTSVIKDKNIIYSALILAYTEE